MKLMKSLWYVISIKRFSFLDMLILMLLSKAWELSEPGKLLAEWLK